MTDGLDSLEDDPRVLQASREYLAELERGKKPDRSLFLARYPELREVLSECFDGIDLAQSLRPPAVESTVEHFASPLGDFQIVREIGRGGMGVVYEAVQLSLGRKVALKVLPFASALDTKHLQRFKTEAYAAAQLHHTHIVPVYAVGCERGMHFYAMQLIEGRSLADVIQQLRNENQSTVIVPKGAQTPPSNTVMQAASSTVHEVARSSPRSQRNRDSFRTAARIAAEIADALEYAHDAGVIHRDVKPANLLMDSKGAVWITDFGLAQVATDVSLTQSGDLIGTLRYMSPEQAAGSREPVDHRSDIYSLGATLYELLTLRPLFPGQDRAALLHQIMHDDPRPLRQLDRAIPVELETIVLKSLSKLPSERYATAGEMAADLRRFLNEIPIRAKRPQLADRLRKWMRRHPSIVGATVIVLILTSLGLSITTAIVTHEHTKADQAYQNELQRAQEAEAQFKLARRVADEMIQLAEDEISDGPLQEGLRKRMLEAALGYYQEFIARRGSFADEQDLAETRNRVQKILGDLALLQADRHLFLLQHADVLDDLGLTAEQRTQVTKLQERFDFKPPDDFFNPSRDKKPRHDGFGPPDRGPGGPGGPGGPFGLPPEFRKRILEQAKLKEVAFAAILSPQQIQRLTQIALQAQGPGAFRELDIARTLKLTSDEKLRINQIMRDTMPRHGPSGGHHGPPDEREWDQHKRLAVQQILEILSPAQKAQWSRMTGKPFVGILPNPFGFPGGRGGGGPLNGPRRGGPLDDFGTKPPPNGAP